MDIADLVDFFGVIVPVLFVFLTLGAAAYEKKRRTDKRNNIEDTPEKAQNSFEHNFKKQNDKRAKDIDAAKKRDVNSAAARIEERHKAGHEMGDVVEEVKPYSGSLGGASTEGCNDHPTLRFISKEVEVDEEPAFDYDKIAMAIVLGDVFANPVGDKREGNF